MVTLWLHTGTQKMRLGGGGGQTGSLQSVRGEDRVSLGGQELSQEAKAPPLDDALQCMELSRLHIS